MTRSPRRTTAPGVRQPEQPAVGSTGKRVLVARDAAVTREQQSDAPGLGRAHCLSRHEDRIARGSPRRCRRRLGAGTCRAALLPVAAGSSGCAIRCAGSTSMPSTVDEGHEYYGKLKLDVYIGARTAPWSASSAAPTMPARFTDGAVHALSTARWAADARWAAGAKLREAREIELRAAGASSTGLTRRTVIAFGSGKPRARRCPRARARSRAPSACSRTITSFTSTSGAEAPAVTPTRACPRSIRA